MAKHFPFFLFTLLSSSLLLSCQNSTKTKVSDQTTLTTEKTTIEHKFSLGQWTFHKALFANEMTTVDFIHKTKELGFQGVDFVNQFFMDKAEDLPFLDSLKSTLDENKLKATLILIDREGDLGNPNDEERKLAIENHKQWIHAAEYLACPSVRFNAFGNGSADEVMEACVASIGILADYAKTKGIEVLIENHGGYSSDPNWLVSLYKKLNRSNVALLPDFDNWCIERENGERWGTPCINEYDRYKGMKLLLPFAGTISIKSFGFDEEGKEIKTDFERVFEMVKETGYPEYMGIEFEGDGMPPSEGLKKTLSLIKRILHKNN